LPNALSANKRDIVQRHVRLLIGRLTRYLSRQTYPEADCARWKEDRDHDDNPRLTRKLNNWNTDNFIHISSLIMSVMYPISRIRLENHVGLIRVKELPVGFRVLSAEAALIESLSNDLKQDIRKVLLSNQTNIPERVWCVAMFEVESINATNNCVPFCAYSFGTNSNLAAIQDKAVIDNSRQVELIKMLNKEN
jgi:hypothetical protein